MPDYENYLKILFNILHPQNVKTDINDVLRIINYTILFEFKLLLFWILIHKIVITVIVISEK